MQCTSGYWENIYVENYFVLASSSGGDVVLRCVSLVAILFNAAEPFR